MQPARAPLLPKLRGQFAEFLNHSSPDRLSILYLTTCVGFGYGPYTHIARGFSRQYRITTITQQKGYASRLTHKIDRISQVDVPHAYTKNIQHLARLPHCVTPSLNYHGSGPTHHQQPHTTSGAHVTGSGWLVSPLHPLSRAYGYGNINPFTIDYACRPRLRTRLTLGRRT